MSTDEKLRTLLCDLGKATRRGVRKCPKCGTANGTRGITCKNKSCDVVFRDVKSIRRKVISHDAVKIYSTNTTGQSFSVRVRDKGPDYRGFVQLCDMEAPDVDVDPDLNSVISFPNATGICFIETCQKGSVDGPCQHVTAALNCCTDSEPLEVKNSVLAALPISNDIKQDVWLLATESPSPVVQRVSKQVMVVKCKEHSKHPLGYLHIAFLDNVKKVNGKLLGKWFHCSCKSLKTNNKQTGKEDELQKCIHFYACVCAFASDEKLSQEFAYFISLDDSLSPCSFVALMEPLGNLEESSLPNLVSEAEDYSMNLLPTPVKKKKKDDTVALASTALLTLQETTNSSPAKKNTTKKGNFNGPKKYVPEPNTPADESQASISFHNWLASVTERINETMHFQFPGNPDPLVFHVPQVFFDCLQRRISAGTKKKRLPNAVTGFVRRDALPLGTFYKYTWHINNLVQVKQIFDTPQMPLELSRSFVENSDGTYEPYAFPEINPAEEYRNKSEKNQPPLIKPREKKTFLKVGTMLPDQKVPSTFDIEWIPNILPKTKIGEMRIKFEYGHMKNQKLLEHRNSSTIPIIQIQTV